MKLFKKIIPIIILGILVAFPAYAGIVPTCATGSSTPTLNCFLDLAVNVSNWILGITGSFALLMFVYGGFMILISRGQQDQIKKGRDALSTAIIGVIIIFGAYVMINFAVKAVGGTFSTTPPKGSSTNKAPTKKPAKKGSSTKPQATKPKTQGPTKATHCMPCICTYKDGFGNPKSTDKGTRPKNVCTIICQQQPKGYTDKKSICK